MENGKQVVDGNLEGIKKSLEGSLKRLKTDYIDLYYLHRVDPNVPIEDIAYLMKNCIKQGKIKHWGISEAGIETKPMQYDRSGEKQISRNKCRRYNNRACRKRKIYGGTGGENGRYSSHPRSEAKTPAATFIELATVEVMK